MDEKPLESNDLASLLSGPKPLPEPSEKLVRDPIAIPKCKNYQAGSPGMY
jgi:hypothetical protein